MPQRHLRQPCGAVAQGGRLERPCSLRWRSSAARTARLGESRVLRLVQRRAGQPEGAGHSAVPVAPTRAGGRLPARRLGLGERNHGGPLGTEPAGPALSHQPVGHPSRRVHLSATSTPAASASDMSASDPGTPCASPQFRLPSGVCSRMSSWRCSGGVRPAWRAVGVAHEVDERAEGVVERGARSRLLPPGEQVHADSGDSRDQVPGAHRQPARSRRAWRGSRRQPLAIASSIDVSRPP